MRLLLLFIFGMSVSAQTTVYTKVTSGTCETNGYTLPIVYDCGNAAAQFGYPGSWTQMGCWMMTSKMWFNDGWERIQGTYHEGSGAYLFSNDEAPFTYVQPQVVEGVPGPVVDHEQSDWFDCPYVDSRNRAQLSDTCPCECSGFGGDGEVKINAVRYQSDICFSVNPDYYSFFPYGCFVFGDRAHWNGDQDSVVKCKAKSDDNIYDAPCLCRFHGADCANTDGTTKNGADCVCGTTACTSETSHTDGTGLYCYSDFNRCSKSVIPVCGNKDGTAANSADCACGTADCDAATGRFCFAAENRCGAPTCGNKDGTAANSADCACGTADCDAATGLFCDAANNKCYDNCANTDGTVHNTANCTCGTTYCYMPATCTHPNPSWCDGNFCDISKNRCAATRNCPKTAGEYGNPDFGCMCGNRAEKCDLATGLRCFAAENRCRRAPCYSTDGTEINVLNCACGTADCDLTTGRFCFAAENRCALPNCGNTDGTVANTANCACGTANCTGSALFCDISKPQCDDVPYCTHTNGTVANDNNCACGTNDCDAATTGLFCDISKNRCDDVPYCTHTNGTVANDNNCACGTNDCTGSALFCDISKNQCDDVPYCTHTNGTVANDNNCACGTTDCNATTGLFCDASKHQCDDVPYCMAGTEVNSGNCMCGTRECDSSTGLFCYAEQSLCAAYPNPRALYTDVSSGTCVTNGYEYIEDMTACQLAAVQVGYKYTKTVNLATTNVVHGCFKWDTPSGISKIAYNGQAPESLFGTPTCDDGNPHDGCICLLFSGPACANTDGTANNTANCACGTANCTGSALFCDAAKNQCDNVPYCANTDGTVANDNNCACGTTDCTGSALFCDAANSACANRVIPVCGNTDGTANNTANCACGTNDCTGSALFCDAAKNQCRGVPYCTNTNGTVTNDNNCACGTNDCDAGTGLFCDTGNNDRCSPVTTCGNTDGTAANDNNCACGTTDCDAANTGLFCFADENRCRFANCGNQDGTAANDNNCACGDVDCTDTALFCDAVENQCDDVPYCVITNGTAANPGNCACGVVDCWSGNGLFCEASQNLCVPYANPRKVYPVITSGTCSSHGFTLPSNGFVCEAPAGARGWYISGTPDYSSSYGVHHPSGCFRLGSELKFNTDLGESFECSSSQPCMCAEFTGPACEHGDSLTENDVTCVCGTSGTCTSVTGMYCDAATSQCAKRPSYPTCTNTDGIAANDNNCACGNTDCDASTTGLFCFWGYGLDNRCDFAPCTNTDGTANNTANCACGNTDCTGSALFCDAANSQCADRVIPVCDNQDGTAPNDNNCACGTTDCDADTGLVCDATNSQCSPGQCTIIDGTATVGTKCACGTNDCEAGEFCTSSLDRCASVPLRDDECTYVKQAYDGAGCDSTCGSAWCETLQAGYNDVSRSSRCCPL